MLEPAPPPRGGADLSAESVAADADVSSKTFRRLATAGSKGDEGKSDDSEADECSRFLNSHFSFIYAFNQGYKGIRRPLPFDAKFRLKLLVKILGYC